MNSPILPYASSDQPPLSRLAVVALVAGIMSPEGWLLGIFYLLFFIGVSRPGPTPLIHEIILTSIFYWPPCIAVVTAVLAKRHIRRSSTPLRGRTLATWGFSCGAMMLIFYVGGIVVALLHW